METAHIIGKILFGGYFLWMGLSLFLKLHRFSGFAASRGVPMPQFAVLVSGVLMFIGGLGVIISYPSSAGLLILFLVPATFVMHPFWHEKEPNARASEMQSFLRNIAFIGAAFILL